LQTIINGNIFKDDVKIPETVMLMLKSNPKTSWNSAESMPIVSSTAFVDDSAMLIGDVRIGEQVYVAPCVSLRADEATPIIIGDQCNVQDGAVFHGLEGSSIELGRRVSIAHGAIIHGPMKIGDESFVGFNAVVHASTLGQKCFVAHGGIVIGVKLSDGKFVPPGTLVDTQEKADSLGPIPDNLKHFNDEVVKVNMEFASGYRLKSKMCDVS
jgi:carbonic anhydrase/acetyltransferase-like protein (isoleucine patch superfamily)